MTSHAAEWLNSPELKQVRATFRAMTLKTQAEDQAWWDSLNGEAKARAFRQIAKLIHQAEVKDRGSYRHAVYEVFGVDYCDGLDCYITLHNLIHRGLDAENRLYRTDDGDDEDEPIDGTDGQ